MMALHFERSEFDARRDRLVIEMAEKKLDAILLFAQESMYWLTGYDTFGFCFFQCLVVKADGSMVLLTRSADLRQARHTSIIDNIVLWTDRDGANPAVDLRNLLNELDLLGARIGVEYDTHGLTAYNGRRLDEQLQTFGQIADASGIVGRLRLFKSPAEIAKAEKAANLADDALDAALPLIKQGGDEALILAAMQGAIFAGGGDYPANEFIIGSGVDALLCRYKAGRRKLTKNDQLTLEWAGLSSLSCADDAHGADRQGLEASPGLVRRGPCRAAGSREGDDAGQQFRRRVRRACPCHGGTWTDQASAECLRLLGRRPLHPVLDGHADVLPGQSRADRAEHDVVRPHDHHGFRNRDGDDAWPHLSHDRITAEAAFPP